jgi:hypothetical protein
MVRPLDATSTVPTGVEAVLKVLAATLFAGVKVELPPPLLLLLPHPATMMASPAAAAAVALNFPILLTVFSHFVLLVHLISGAFNNLHGSRGRVVRSVSGR